MSIRETAATLGYRAGWSGVRHLPEGAAYALFRRFADSAWRKRSRSVEKLEMNIARAVETDDPDALRELSRAGMRSYFRYWCDAFRLPDWDRERVVSRCRVLGEDGLRGHLESGRGVVAALPHMGNWDHAGAYACLTTGPITTVAEKLKSESLYRKFVWFREQLGMEIVPHRGSGVSDLLAERLDQGRLVPLLADRDLSRHGVDVTLLGADIRMPAGPAALALRTGAALVPVTLWYEGDEPNHQIVVRFHDELDIPEQGEKSEKIRVLSQRIADTFSEGIRRNPTDWHMVQRVFLDDLAANDPRRMSPMPEST